MAWRRLQGWIGELGPGARPWFWFYVGALALSALLLSLLARDDPFWLSALLMVGCTLVGGVVYLWTAIDLLPMYWSPFARGFTFVLILMVLTVCIMLGLLWRPDLGWSPEPGRAPPSQESSGGILG